jgi:hypothetical protein
MQTLHPSAQNECNADKGDDTNSGYAGEEHHWFFGVYF